VYLAADNGLLVCLRDAAPKYARPVRIWPAPEVNPPKRINVESQPDKGKNPDAKEPEKKP
jgi:hypothetical protein